VGQIAIRAADLSADRDTLIDLLRRYSTERSNRERYEWLYQDNPHGTAAVFLAIDSTSGATIGSGAVLPRKMWVEGAPQVAAVMADFWIHPEHRSLGPAVKLQRACVEYGAALGFAFFDLPQGQMPAVYRRMGLLGNDRVTRYAKPLRLGALVEKRIAWRLAARAVTALGDPLLRVADRWAGRAGALKIERHDGDFGVEFDELLRDAASIGGVRVARSAAYLQWRYRRHYYLRYAVHVAREGRKLRGYAVTVDAGGTTEIADLFPTEDPGIAVDLLLGVAQSSRASGAASLAATLLPARSPVLAAFARVGLRERESRPFVIHEYRKGGSAVGGEPIAHGAWLLTYGDIDY
jgi:hypothetical protein